MQDACRSFATRCVGRTRQEARKCLPSIGLNLHLASNSGASCEMCMCLDALGATTMNLFSRAATTQCADASLPSLLFVQPALRSKERERESGGSCRNGHPRS